MDPDAKATELIAAMTMVVLKRELHAAFPFMTPEAIAQVSSEATSAIGHGIRKAKPAMDASKARFNFFSLPPELRNNIYEMALTPEIPSQRRQVQVQNPGFPVPDPDDTSEFVSENTHKRYPVKTPALLHVCRQIRAETFPIYYGTNDFYAWYPEHVTRDSNNHLREWLQMLGSKQASKIKVVELLFDRDLWDLGWDIEILLSGAGIGRSTDEFVVIGGGRCPKIRKVDVLEAYGLTGLGVKDEDFKVFYSYEEDYPKRLR